MSSTSVLTFTLGDTLLAVERTIVEEVFVISSVTAVPVAPPFMGWVTNWQGNIIPVVDLSPFVSQKLKGIIAHKTALALKAGGKDSLFGLIVDQIGATRDLREVGVPKSQLPYFAKARLSDTDSNRIWLISPARIEQLAVSHMGKVT